MAREFQRNFAFLWLSTFFIYVSGSIFMSTSSLYFSYVGLSYVEIGAIASIGSLSMVMLPSFVGRLSDLWSKRKLVILCNLVDAALAPAYILSRSFLSIIPLQVLVPALYWTSESNRSAIVVDITKTGKIASNLAMLRTSSLGWSVGALSAGFILQNFGFNVVFIVISIFYFLAVLSISQFREEAPKKAFHEESPKQPRLFISYQMVGFLIITVIVFSTMPAFHSFLPLYMKNELGAPESVIPLIFAITPLGEIPLALLMGRLSDKVGRWKIILVCLLAFPLRWTAIILAGDYVLVILIQILHGLTFASLYTVSIAYLSDMVSSHERGIIVGTYSTCLSLGATLGGYVLGFTVQNYGFVNMYIQAAATSLPAALGFLLIELRRREFVKNKCAPSLQS